MRVKVPPHVLEGIEAVRDTGIDMECVPIVRSLSMGFCFQETSFWLELHEKDYREGLKCGFEPDPSSTFEIGRIC